MIRIPLTNDLRRQAAKRAIDAAKEGDEMSIVAPSKTREQEEAYHAMFGDIAKQCKHLNECFDTEGWKRLLVDQFRSDMLADPHCDAIVREDLQRSVRMVPSLDGRSIVAIGLQTRKFRRKTASAFLDWLNAYCGTNEVRLSAPRRFAA